MLASIDCVVKRGSQQVLQAWLLLLNAHPHLNSEILLIIQRNSENNAILFSTLGFRLVAVIAGLQFRLVFAGLLGCLDIGNSPPGPNWLVFGLLGLLLCLGLVQLEVFAKVIVLVDHAETRVLLLDEPVEGDPVGQVLVFEPQRDENPVVDVVKLVALLEESLFQHSPQVVVVRDIFVLEEPHVLHKLFKLFRESFAKFGYRGFLHALPDVLPLLLDVFALHLTPRQAPLQEIDKHQAHRLQIVSAAVPVAPVHIQAGEPERAHEVVFVDGVGPGLFRLGVDAGGGEGEVDGVHLVKFLAQSHQEVAWLHIAMHIVLVMDELDTGQHLLGNHEGGLEGEGPPADVQVLLQRVAQQFSHQEPEVAILPKPHKVRDADSALQVLQHPAFVQHQAQVHVLQLGLALDGAIGIGLHIFAHIHRRVLSFVDLLLYPVSPADPNLQRAHLNLQQLASPILTQGQQMLAI